MTQATTAATGSSASARRSSRLGTAARVAAVVGIILSVLLIVGTWLGRGALVGAIDDLQTTVSSAFGRAQTATGQVTDRLDAAAVSAGELAASANALAANPAPPPDALSGLADKVGRLADAYRTVRTRYAEVRENVTNAVTAVQRVARFVPGVDAPEGAGDRIQALDAKLQSIDDTLTGIFPSLETGGPSGTVAAAVAQHATSLQSALTDASATVAGVSASIDGLAARATNVTDSLQRLVTIGTVLLTLLLFWILVLHLALWQLGGRWKQDAAMGLTAAEGDAASR
jgi:hypothetical protein